MSIETLEFAEPFFTVRLVKEEATYRVFDRSIVLNLSEEPIKVQDQKINYLNSVIVSNTLVFAAEYCIVIERFDEHSDQTSLFEKVNCDSAKLVVAEPHSSVPVPSAPRSAEG